MAMLVSRSVVAGLRGKVCLNKNGTLGVPPVWLFFLLEALKLDPAG